MNKIFASLMVLAAIVSSSFAAAWTAPTAYPVSVSVILSKNVYPTDSLTGTDSTTVWSGIQIDPTCTYALRTLDSIGAGDSMGIALRVYNSSSTLVYAGESDVVSASVVYKISDLPINKTVHGSTMTIKVIGKVGSSRKKVREAALVRISPVEPNKQQFLR